MAVVIRVATNFFISNSLTLSNNSLLAGTSGTCMKKKLFLENANECTK